MTTPDPTPRTRDCTDPWEMVFIHSDRNVTLCCWGLPVGHLDRESLETIVQGDQAREIRSRLLSGDLDPSCRNCPSRGWTTTDELLGRVEEIQERDPLDELDELRSRIRRLDLEREQLTLHRQTIESELTQLRLHAKTIGTELKHAKLNVKGLEEERYHLRGHVANLERILTKIHGMKVYRGLCRIKDLVVRPGPRRET